MGKIGWTEKNLWYKRRGLFRQRGRRRLLLKLLVFLSEEHSSRSRKSSPFEDLEAPGNGGFSCCSWGTRSQGTRALLDLRSLHHIELRRPTLTSPYSPEEEDTHTSEGLCPWEWRTSLLFLGDEVSTEEYSTKTSRTIHQVLKQWKLYLYWLLFSLFYDITNKHI